jgi:alkanesulfonate monooxygenase SsuD/methylene tetrahydromethanopterin reductase-like flavin-dependent oxidoreductase (luciferase family)
VQDQLVYPRPEAGTIRTWIGVGGSPESVVRAARYGIPLMLAIIGGEPRRFAPMVDLYHRALTEFGQTTQPIGAHSPGHVGDDDERAREELWPHYKAMHDRIGAERGWGPLTRDAFEREAGPPGSLYVGSPETVATKIAAMAQVLGLDRFDLKISSGPLPHELLMGSIERYGTEVIPRVRELLADADHTKSESAGGVGVLQRT